MSSLLKTLLPVVGIGMLLTWQACDRTVTRVVENRDVTDATANCFECHSDDDTFLIAAGQQWENSFHASGLNIDRGSRESCAGCHVSEGFVQRANGEPVTGHDNPSVIHCFTCHAPHTNGDFSLRWTEDAELQDGTTFDLSNGNTCVSCHHSRRDVNTYVGSGDGEVSITSTHWGPHHGPQGDILLGSNGYEYPGFNYESTPHRSATRDGCLDCHYKSTSNNLVGGHAFNMRGDARDEGGEFSELLNTAACEPCHGEIDDFNYNGRQAEIQALVEELGVLLEDAGLLTDGHPIRQSEPTTADQAGALWNYLLAEEDRSQGIHNPKYMKGLLESSIMFMNGTLKPAPGVDRDGIPAADEE